MDRARKAIGTLLVFCFLPLFAEQVEVNADNFFADESKLWANLAAK